MGFNFGDKVKITDKNSEHSERAYYREYSLEPYAEEDIEDLYYDFEVAGNVVIARLFDGNGNELQRGHGHIIHEGIKGFTQAASYALKKIFEKYNDGQL